jgi:hypothetical protein
VRDEGVIGRFSTDEEEEDEAGEGDSVATEIVDVNWKGWESRLGVRVVEVALARPPVVCCSDVDIVLMKSSATAFNVVW